MTFNEYQEKTSETAVYPNCCVDTTAPVDECRSLVDARFMYPVIGLAGECGEISEKFKKIIRDKGGLISEKDRELIMKEIGDASWYLAQICTCIGASFEECAEGNIKKLADRKARGVLQGSGDER